MLKQQSSIRLSTERKNGTKGEGGRKGSRRKMEEVEKARKSEGRAEKNTGRDIETVLGF